MRSGSESDNSHTSEEHIVHSGALEDGFTILWILFGETPRVEQSKRPRKEEGSVRATQSGIVGSNKGSAESLLDPHNN